MDDKKNRHIHKSKSTRDILSAKRVLSEAGLKAGNIFLDAGCGDGFISIEASSLVGNEGKVYAVDSYPESVGMVKKEVNEKGITNLDALVADLTDNIPLNDAEIDLGVMANVLHGFVANEEVEEVMKEIRRVIKVGGAFAVVEFKKEEGLRGPPLNVRITTEEVAEIVSQYGFEVIKTTEVGDYHYLLKAVKK